VISPRNLTSLVFQVCLWDLLFSYYFGFHTNKNTNLESRGGFELLSSAQRNLWHSFNYLKIQHNPEKELLLWKRNLAKFSSLWDNKDTWVTLNTCGNNDKIFEICFETFMTFMCRAVGTSCFFVEFSSLTRRHSLF